LNPPRAAHSEEPSRGSLRGGRGRTEEEGHEWLLLYDFKGTKPGTKFYMNLTRLSTHKGKTALLQYSAFLTSSRRVALAAKKLATHYGAETTLFKVMGTDI
jgi:hypothetical protein